jgi:hypothetical protein
VQTELLAKLNVPAAQVVHVDAPAVENFPVEQSKQLYVPTPSLYFPAAHATHGVPVKPTAHVASAGAPAAATSTASSAARAARAARHTRAMPRRLI